METICIVQRWLDLKSLQNNVLVFERSFGKWKVDGATQRNVKTVGPQISNDDNCDNNTV